MEMNYMPNEPDRKYCDVCLAALKLIDPNTLLPDDDMETVLCPRCKQNYISPDEDMCESCREMEKKSRKDIEPDWNELVDGDVDPDDVYDDDPVEISFDELAEEEEERGRDEFAPEDEENPDYDDFDTNYDDLDDDDFDDEDEDEEEFEFDEE